MHITQALRRHTRLPWRRTAPAGSAGHPLAGRVVLLTGATGSLGRALALELARQQARLALVARDQAALDQLVRELALHSVTVMAVSADIRDRAEVQRAVHQVWDRFGAVDVLITATGTVTAGRVDALPRTAFTDALDVMFWGTVYPVMALLPGMRERGFGRIMIVASAGGKVPLPFLLPYTAAQHAVTGFAAGLRVELAGSGIHVTTVIPALLRGGSVHTTLTRAVSGPALTWWAGVPVTAMDTATAARRIVAALTRDEAELYLGRQARLVAAVMGLMPGLLLRRLAGTARQWRVAGTTMEAPPDARAGSGAVLNLVERAPVRVVGRPRVDPADLLPIVRPGPPSDGRGHTHDGTTSEALG